MSRSPNTHLSYRPALDGLRGVAVLAVLIFHLWPTALPGGWLGVDLFFVLSGFLITSLLVREYSRTGRIDLIRFWTARMRRLLPSLVVVLLAVVLMMALWTVPARRAAVSLDILSSLSYIANWRLLLSNEAYFAQVGTPSPLRHTWSLGLEEQYYLLFPLLILLLSRVVSKYRHLAWCFIALAGLSAAWMAYLYTPGIAPTRIYYGTDTRVFELFIGAAAGAWTGPRQWGQSGPARWLRTVQAGAWPALAVLVAAFSLVADDTPLLFRGGLVLFATMALIPILASASPHPSSFQRALAWEPLRRLGLISYALYLWHWPLHTFLTPDRLHLNSVIAPFVQAALALVCAVLTYRFIERPIRTRGLHGFIPRVPQLGPLLASVAILAVVGSAFALPTVPPLVSNKVETGASGGNLHFPETEYRPGRQAQNIVLVGNSIPASLMAYFPNAQYPDLHVTQETSFGCTPYDNNGELTNGQQVKIPSACVDYQRDWVKFIQNKDVLLYFVPQNLLHDQKQSGKTLKAGTSQHDAWVTHTFNLIKQAAVAHGVKHVAFLTFACHRMPTFGASTGDNALVNDDQKVEHLNALITSWSAAHGVSVFDQYNALCPRNQYYGRINGHDLYADALHFTDKSGPIMWSWLAPKVQRLGAS